MKKWIWAVLGMVVMQATAATISQEVALERALSWMNENPVMVKASQTVESVTVFPDTGSYSVYVVQLAPKGFLILNSDNRLPLAVSFSTESQVDLTDDPQNALRAMLIDYCEQKVAALANWGSPVAMGSPLAAPTAEDELHGPFLETSWNQNSPYNLLCPSAGTSGSYEGRAPVGCVPTTYAQLMNYHRWPCYGTGSRSYTDSSGGVTGSHSADFTDGYDWDLMQASHSTGDPQTNQDAVAELMYELGIAAEVNYEASGTSGSTSGLGGRLNNYFFFEPIESHNSQADLIAPMEAELRAGFPCIVTFPGHAFIADGLLVDGGVTTYHFNLGWGGSNNGWYTKDAAPTGGGSAALDGGVTSLRPKLMAFPLTNSISVAAGGSAELNWILPKRRENEVSELLLKKLTQQSGNWQSDASEITVPNTGWEVVSAGRSGDCWFTGPNNGSVLELPEVFVPDASSSLSFWYLARLYVSIFSVEISTDHGENYTALFSTPSDVYHNSWQSSSISLAAYAGQQVKLRFVLSESGGFYSSSWAGIRVDDIAVTSGDWYDWETLAEDTALKSRRFSEVTTLWDDCDDFSVFEATSSSSYRDWIVSTNSGVANCFYKEPGGYTNQRYHLTSWSTITPGVSTRLLIHGKYKAVYDESFRVMVSTDRVSFSEIWSVQGSVDWGDIVIDLSAYAGQAVYIRLEYYYPEGGYTVGGGVWIDSISTQEVTNPELEGQPIHYTALLTNLPAGTHTLAAVLTDTNAVEHMQGPAFTLTVAEGNGDDGDGIPADWEIQYGLDPEIDDGELDPDGDGFSNWKEYICGTVPTNAASVWKLSMGPGFLPVFQGLDNRIYTIEYCDELASNDWKSMVSGIVGSNGLFEVNSFESATNIYRFYRVTVQEAD
ncbi:C10 family peptidase [Pontiellaceae bacterium B1224]|nr:C10 family peptidase [Pontiellaceae bacterium B1224]